MTTATRPRPRTRYALEPKWLDLLTDGDQVLGDRSRAVMSFTLHVINRGWDWTQYCQAMTDPDHRLGDYFRFRRDGRRRTDATKRMQYLWAKAQARVQANEAIYDKASARAEVAAIKAEVARCDLSALGIPRRAHTTAREVLEYVYREAQRRGRIVLSIAVRDIELGTSVPRRTVIRTLQRLIRAGLLTRAQERSHVRQAQVYRLHSPAACQSTDDTTASALGAEGATRREGSGDIGGLKLAPIEITRHDAFLALGRYRGTIYAALNDEGLKADQITQITGFGRSTVHKHLKYLADQGLAASEGGHWTRTSRCLDEAAAEMGVTGLAAQRAQRVADERTRWDEIADKVQFQIDRARHGLRHAIERALAWQKTRAEQKAKQQVTTLADGTKIDTDTGEIITPDAPTARPHTRLVPHPRRPRWLSLT